MKPTNYIAITRPDHWFKNLFVLPGTAFAAILTRTPIHAFAWPLFWGLVSTCLISSANYVINEWLDAEFDRFHPEKKNRPSVAGALKRKLVYIEYGMVLLAGLGTAVLVSSNFAATSVLFAVMGIIYNVKPFRTKDRVYCDVLSESINNPIRLMLGWFIVAQHPFPPTSLLIGYWMGGGFLMAIKRYAEIRFMADRQMAGQYRRSFRFYTEEKLLISSFVYAICSSFFLGVFLVKYRIELFLSLPFIAILFGWYLHIGMQKDSNARYPERLFREKAFLSYVILLICIIGILLFCDMPILKWLLSNAFVSPQWN